VPPTDFPAFPVLGKAGRRNQPRQPTTLERFSGAASTGDAEEIGGSRWPGADSGTRNSCCDTDVSAVYCGHRRRARRVVLDSLITSVEPASPDAQGAPLLTPYFPGQGPAFGDQLGNALGVPSPETPLRRVSSAFPGMTLPDRDPMPPPQPRRPLGIFTGRPMPSWTIPPPLGGQLNNSNASGDSDWLKLLAGLDSRNSTQPEPPQQTAGSIPERRLGRSILNQSPAPAYDPGAAAAPRGPSVDANYSGGLRGMYAALAATDRRDPNQPAPPDDEQEQANIQALEARLSSSGNVNDAWALYNARKASRR